MSVSVNMILLQHILVVVAELGKKGIIFLAIMIFPSAIFRTHRLASKKWMASAVIHSAMTNSCLNVIPETVFGTALIPKC